MSDPMNPTEETGTAPSRVVAGLLAVLAILPTLMLVLLLPEMSRQAAEGHLAPWQFALTLAEMVLLPAGLALLFFDKRAALPLFVGAMATGLATVGSPFGRIVLGGVLVALFGAIVAWLRLRDAPGHSRAD